APPSPRSRLNVAGRGAGEGVADGGPETSKQTILTTDMEGHAMGLLDNLSGTLKSKRGKTEVAAGAGRINAALAKTGLGNLQGLIATLEAGGLGAQVKSWLGDGRKLPVSPE